MVIRVFHSHGSPVSLWVGNLGVSFVVVVIVCVIRGQKFKTVQRASDCIASTNYITPLLLHDDDDCRYNLKFHRGVSLT